MHTTHSNTQYKNQITVKWAQWDKTQSRLQRTVSLFICVCIALCTIVAHNIAQNRPDSFPPYPPDNHPAPMMSIWGKGEEESTYLHQAWKKFLHSKEIIILLKRQQLFYVFSTSPTASSCLHLTPDSTAPKIFVTIASDGNSNAD